MGLKLPKFSNILDDIGGAATNVVHAIGNAAGSAADAALPGNQSSLHPSLSQPQPSQAPPPQRPQAPGGLGGFGSITGGPSTFPGNIVEHKLFPTPPAIGATSTPAPNQQPLQVAQAKPPTLQVGTPQKPNGQPLTATVVHTPTLQVGNQQIAQSPTAVSGVKAPIQPGNLGDALGAGAAATLSSGLKAAANTVKSTTDLRFLTPNFIPGVSSTIDPLIGRLSSTATAPLTGLQQQIDRGAQNNDLYGTQAGQTGKTIGNATGTTAIYAPQAIEAVEGGVSAVKNIPQILERAKNLVSDTTTAGKGVLSAVQDLREPLDEAGGAKAGDILPDSAFPEEQNANQLPSPAPPETTSPTGVDANLGTIGEVGKGTTPVSPQDQQMFKSLGGNPDDLSSLLKLNDQQKAELDSNTQMALDKFQKGTGRPTRSLEENIAANPFRDQNVIPEVAPGDYEKARINGQQASRPILSLADTAGHHADQANLTTGRLADLVEGTAAPQNESEKQAVESTKNLFGTALSTSHSLGGNTETRPNYFFHDVDLPEDVKSPTGGGAGGETFNGINNMGRIHNTRADLNAAGLHLVGEDAPASGYLANYGNRAANALQRQAHFKGLTEADQNEAQKLHTIDLGGGHSVKLSKEGAVQSKGIESHIKSDNPLVKGYRKLNRASTHLLLTHTGVHEANLSLRAGPGLALKGHPVSALKAVGGSFRGNFDKDFVAGIKARAATDGMVEKAAKIGAPYSTGKGGLLDRQISPIHDQVVRSVIGDLEKKGVSLDSTEARKAGKAASGMVGEMNYEAMNVSRRTQNALGDLFLARQYTPSKFYRLKQAATQGGTAGAYARTTLAGDVLGTTALLGGIGYAAKQKSDDLKDIFLRALISPSVPIPGQNKAGDDQQLKFLGTDSSDIARILGVSLVRNKDGHLGVTWKPGNMPSTSATYLRDRLSPVLSDATKVVTNSNYSGKPLYDPTTTFGRKLEQAGTSLAVGHLPIPAQSLAYAKVVKEHTPQAVQQVLNANTPKSNVAANALAGVVGLTPANDTTRGKGQQATQYYNALDNASKGLNPQEKAALTILTESKKNPVTGAYDVKPTAFDTSTKALLQEQNPKVLQALTTLNKKLQSDGQKVDPFYNLSSAQQKSYLAYEKMPPGGADRSNWEDHNQNWYQNFSQQRSNFFNSLPAGDPNKPKAPVQYPTFNSQTSNLLTQYNNASTADKSTLLENNPQLSNAFDQIANYTNANRTAQGYAALKGYPKADPQTQSALNTYDTLAKGDKSAYMKAHPNITSYLTQVSLYNLDKNAGKDVFQGNTPDQEELKSAYGLGNYDINKNSDGTYTLTNGNTAGGSGGSYGGTGYSSSGSSGYSNGSSINYTAQKINDINTAHKVPGISAKHTVSIRKPGKAKVGKLSKPKTLKVTAPKGTLV